ncbi:MAG: T9SS type A sorting domain-containing protein [Desulfobulbaceae bacterium]|nr:T9SS type A sorting domain-containing protein [Desulfobulbaceae bacterium]
MLRISLLFLVFVFSSIHLLSQPTIIREMMPKVGDKYVLYDCDTTGVVAGNKGANINWDFSSLTRLSGSDYMTLLEFIEPEFAPQADKFPLATIAQMNDTAAVFYRQTSGGFFRLGIGAFELYEIIDSPYDQHFKFPFAYNEKLTSSYKSKIYVETEDGDMEMQRYGETMVEYDAYGTLKMPGKEYGNVYRLHYKSTIYDTVQIMEGFPPMIIKTEMTNYAWHASTSIQPILTISNIVVSYIGFPGAPVYTNNVTYSEFGEGTIELLPPTLKSPANNSVDIEIPVLLQWEEPVTSSIGNESDEFQAAEEIQYHLQVSSNPGFSTMDFEATISTTSQNVFELEIGTTYYWRVRSIRGEEISEFSSIWNFKTKIPDEVTVPDPPILISPTNGEVVASKMPTLIWEDATGVDYSWKIEVAKDANFTDVIYSENPRLTNTLEFDYELEAGNYFWHVAVHNGEAWSEWSATWYFVIEGGAIVLNPPTLLEPADGSQDLPLNAITFSWDDDESASVWVIQIAEDENFDFTFVTDETETNQITVNDFEPYTTYYWRVLSSDGVNVSEWSDVRSFTTMIGGNVNNIYSGNMMKISPNPTQDFIQITLDIEGNQNAKFEIRDINGKLLMSENLGMISGNKLNIERSISNFASGKYFAIFKIGDKAYISPFNITR